MNRNIAYPILLLLTLFLGEIHNVWGTSFVNEKQWFLLSDLKQDLEWYIKDTAEAVIWLVFLFIWYKREQKRSSFWANIILLFIIFRSVDILCYWVNHRHAGGVYLLTYLSIGIYGCFISIREYKRNK